jgi:hypothetical protein
VKQFRNIVSYSHRMKKQYLVLLFSFLFSTNHLLLGQKTFLDSTVFMSALQIGFGIQLPGQDLKKRFGTNSVLEGQFGIKTASNLYFGVRGSFLFGNNVKEDSILKAIETSTGNILDDGGELGTIFFDERGYSLFLIAGKIIPVLSPNPNSGFFVSLGGGLLQHKIRLEFRDSRIPQLEPAYREGYDRLSNGFAINAFLGYVYLSKRRLINFYAGFDYTQAWTVNRREYNFDTMAADRQKRIDVLSGFKVGWVLPLYRSQPDEFYLY